MQLRSPFPLALFGGAQVNFTRSDSEDTIVEAVVAYDDARAAPALTTSSSGGSFTAKFTSDIESDNDQVPEIEKWEVIIGSFGGLTQIWELTVAELPAAWSLAGCR